jgi:hypothetical protein
MIMDDDEYDANGGMFGKGNQSARRKPSPVPLCPPQIPQDLHGLELGPPLWEAGN